MHRAPRTWESSIVEKLKKPFGWQEAEAKNEVGRLINLPNRNSLSSLFLAAAIDFRYRINQSYRDEMNVLVKGARDRGVYPSMLIPEMQEKKTFPRRSKLETLVDETVTELRQSKEKPKTDNEIQVYLREKDEVVSYFLLLIDSEVFQSKVEVEATPVNSDEESEENE